MNGKLKVNDIVKCTKTEGLRWIHKYDLARVVQIGETYTTIRLLNGVEMLINNDMFYHYFARVNPKGMEM